jgi:Zn-dependent protease
MKVGRFYGIDVHIHWTFWLLILLYLYLVAKSGQVAEGLIGLSLVLAAFFCILLHEYGHSLAARYFGIRTLDITLTPIGGVARLERLPEKPMQELVVAIAGPLVNVAIAGLLWLVILFGIGSDWAAPSVVIEGGPLGQLLALNLILVAFNMLPAFPMDGDRVLRSLLALKFGFIRATEIAARIGRWMSLVFAIWGIWTMNPLLVILAAFVFITGTIELFHAKIRSLQRSSSPFGNSPDGASRRWPDADGSQPEQSSREGDVIDAVDYRRVK